MRDEAVEVCRPLSIIFFLSLEKYIKMFNLFVSKMTLDLDIAFGEKKKEMHMCICAWMGNFPRNKTIELRCRWFGTCCTEVDYIFFLKII